MARDKQTGEQEVGGSSRACDMHADTIARIDANLIAVLEWQRKSDLRFNDGDHALQNHNERIDRLEKIILGAVGLVLLGVLGMAGTALVWVIQHLPGK